MAVFTNFAATLAKQPSAASLAPRLNKKIPKFSHVNKSKTLRNFLAHCVEGFKMGSRTWMPELGETFERQSPLPTVRSELLCKRT